MEKSINRDWLIISLIIAVIIAVISFLFTKNFEISYIVFSGVLIIIIAMLLFSRCSRCGNLGALQNTSTNFLGSKQYQDYFTRREAAGRSITRNRYGETVAATTHYMDVNYIDTVTVNTYEDTLVCKHCGDISKKRYQRDSHDVRRA